MSPHIGTGYAECRYESSTLRNDDWLITQQINLPTGSAELRFWCRSHSAINYETLQVRISTTGNAINDFNNILGDFHFNNTGYNEFILPLNGFNGQDVYIAFVNKGLYQRKIYLDDIMIKGFTLGVEEPTLVSRVQKTMLYPIKPNPIVRNTVNINFSLVEPTPVSLKIYNASGRIVRTLANNQQLTTNNYSLNWNCRDYNGRKVAEGVYFISLETPKQKFTRKIILTK
jgi:hypothetical protein